jgi:hypothetical protein
MMNYTVVFAYSSTVDGEGQKARLRVEQVEAPSHAAAIAMVASRCPATPQDAVSMCAVGIDNIEILVGEPE